MGGIIGQHPQIVVIHTGAEDGKHVPHHRSNFDPAHDRIGVGAATSVSLACTGDEDSEIRNENQRRLFVPRRMFYRVSKSASHEDRSRAVPLI
jgi:hypothetical protein